MVNSISQWLRRERAMTILACAALLSVGVHELTRRPMPPVTRPRHARPADSRSLAPAGFLRWREAFLEANAPYDAQGLARGVFLGDAPDVRPDVRELFREAGLSHFLAADGFKCWFTSAAFGALLSLLLAALGPLLPARALLLTRLRGASLARLAGAWLFWLWSDQSAAVTRAATMITERHILELLGFRIRFGRLLAAQYLVSLAILPRLWHSASFQLTYGCILGMIWIPRLFARTKPKGRLARFAWTSFFSSLGAALGAAPTTWFAFGEFTLTGVLTHWLATPIVVFAMMPLGMAQMLLLAPGLCAPGARVVVALAKGSAAVSAFLYGALKSWMSIIPHLEL